MGEHCTIACPLENKAARGSRRLLGEALAARGFHNYPQEWWHYTYQPEPWPDRYFDIPAE